MCPMVNVFVCPDHGLGHNCDEALQFDMNFNATHEVITFLLSYIYRIYTPGEDLYQQYRICAHGLPLQFMMVQLARFGPDDDDNDDDDDGPESITIDIYHHGRTYLQMIQNLSHAQDIADNISDLLS